MTTHVYLTEANIKEALKAHAITEREAKELTTILKRSQRVQRHTRTQVQMAS